MDAWCEALKKALNLEALAKENYAQKHQGITDEVSSTAKLKLEPWRKKKVQEILKSWLQTASNQESDLFSAHWKPRTNDTLEEIRDKIVHEVKSEPISVSDDKDRFGRQTIAFEDGSTITCHVGRDGSTRPGRAELCTKEWTASGKLGNSGKLEGQGKVICHLTETATFGYFKEGCLHGPGRIFSTRDQRLMLIGHFLGGRKCASNDWTFTEAGGALIT